MGTAVKTSPITAAPPFTVAPNNERERADGFTLISVSGRNRVRTDRFHSMGREKYAVLPFRPSSALDYFGLITISKWATPSGLATSPPLFD